MKIKKNISLLIILNNFLYKLLSIFLAFLLCSKTAFSFDETHSFEVEISIEHFLKLAERFDMNQFCKKVAANSGNDRLQLVVDNVILNTIDSCKRALNSDSEKVLTEFWLKYRRGFKSNIFNLSDLLSKGTLSNQKLASLRVKGEGPFMEIDIAPSLSEQIPGYNTEGFFTNFDLILEVAEELFFAIGESVLWEDPRLMGEGIKRGEKEDLISLHWNYGNKKWKLLTSDSGHKTIRLYNIYRALRAENVFQMTFFNQQNSVVNYRVYTDKGVTKFKKDLDANVLETRVHFDKIKNLKEEQDSIFLKEIVDQERILMEMILGEFVINQGRYSAFKNPLFRSDFFGLGVGEYIEANAPELYQGLVRYLPKGVSLDKSKAVSKFNNSELAEFSELFNSSTDKIGIINDLVGVYLLEGVNDHPNFFPNLKKMMPFILKLTDAEIFRVFDKYRRIPIYPTFRS